ncbi:MAG: enoyl-CoA hydratase-related protein [Acidimicrobiales bacterium]
MCDEVAEALSDELEADESIKSLVVTGAAPAFCAGADLTHLGESAEEGLLAIYEGFLRVGRSPLPTIAAVNAWPVPV